MSTSKNKAIFRRVDEVWNKGNVAILSELIAPNFVCHIIPEVKGPEGYKQYVIRERTAFPDFHGTIDKMVAEGDMVAAFYTFGGTFKGELAGIAPTGKKFTLPYVVLSRFEGGKMAEAWEFTDSLTWYRQLGIPIPPA
jgi:predicted ester cyclase